MARNYVFAPGEYYHVYARGVEKLPVFREQADYQRFIAGMYLFNSKQKGLEIRDFAKLSGGLTSGEVFEADKGESIADIGAYCLMPNHFHILVREKNTNDNADGKGVSKFMQKLMTSYTMYVNKKYERTGAVFGSSFKAQHVTSDTHLKYLFAYIHLNPRSVAGLNLQEFKYSSYAEYTGADRPQKSILQKDAFPDYFEGKLQQEVEDWIRAGSDFRIGELPEV